jgi:translation elongation factor EF-G
MAEGHLVEVAIELKSKADQEKLGVALSELAAEDASFRFSTDPHSGQIILKGMDELHLDAKLDVLKRTYKVDVNIGQAQVAYLEKLTKKVEINYTHKKQTGGAGQFAKVDIIFEPAEAGAGSSFESKIVGDAAPKGYISGKNVMVDAPRIGVGGRPTLPFPNAQDTPRSRSDETFTRHGSESCPKRGRSHVRRKP